jgi:glycogen synthase
MADLVSLRAYAKHRDCRRGVVEEAIHSGRISDAVVRDSTGRLKGIYQAEADALWDANTDPVMAAKSSSKSIFPTREAYLEHRSKRERFLADQAEIDYLEAVGRLVAADEVKQAQFEIARILRDRLTSAIDRIDGMLATVPQSGAIRKALHEDFRKLLHELAGHFDTLESAARSPEREVALL